MVPRAVPYRVWYHYVLGSSLQLLSSSAREVSVETMAFNGYPSPVDLKFPDGNFVSISLWRTTPHSKTHGVYGTDSVPELPRGKAPAMWREWNELAILCVPGWWYSLSLKWVTLMEWTHNPLLICYGLSNHTVNPNWLFVNAGKKPTCTHEH